jgi:hypothetical protein
MEEKTEAIIIPRRVSGQDIGNPIPPSIILIPHEGHKADADSWTRTKNVDYKKKMAKQRIIKGATDKWMENLLVARHHD